MDKDECNCYECGDEFENGDMVFEYGGYLFCCERCLGYHVAKNDADEIEVEFDEPNFEEEE